MSRRRIGGTCYLKIDGTQYALRGNLEISPNLSTRSGVAGMDGIHGYTEKPKVPYVSGDLTDLGGLSITTLHAIDDATITVELANGKTYVLSNAWYADDPNIKADEGTVPFKFEGVDCKEMGVSS